MTDAEIMGHLCANDSQLGFDWMEVTEPTLWNIIEFIRDRVMPVHSVEEQLPERGEPVLAYGHLAQGKDWWYAAYLSNSDVWYTDIGYTEDRRLEITHWMPMPPIPTTKT